MTMHIDQLSRQAIEAAVQRVAPTSCPMTAAVKAGNADRPGLSHLPEDYRPAAVLVPIVERPTGLQLLLTKRAAHLRKHPGQVSFPGGSAEEHDDGPVATALRETQEELGVAAAQVEVSGYLEPYLTVTHFCVQPVVGFVIPDYTLVVDSGEVAEVFELPLAVALDPAYQQRQSREFNGQMHSFYMIEHEKRIVWGATAGMLVSFSRLLGLRSDAASAPAN